MQITRIYNNAAAETLRIDTITIDVQPPIYKNLTIRNDPGLQMRVGPQKVKTILVSKTSGSRTVDTIELTGDFVDYEASSGSFDWASKTLGNGQVVKFDMQNLPKISETV